MIRRIRRFFRTELWVPAAPLGGSIPTDRDRERLLEELRAIR
jgi:hypothetical protein